jgi:hypothetical protein
MGKFIEVWNELEEPLTSFFVDFLFGEFKINKAEIVPKKLATYPMMIYFYLNYKKGKKFTAFGNENISLLKKYFILSQINDWNLQSIIDEFNRQIKTAVEKSEQFPLQNMLNWVSAKRKTKLLEADFVDYHWFSLKMLMPDRIYQFDPEISGRFNPEIDHISPKKLENQDNEYYNVVDSIWNMQPIKGDINNYKRKRHPKEFFSSEEGKKYLNQYDFLPTKNTNDAIWDNPLQFIQKRKELMTKFLNEKYGLSFEPESTTPTNNL